MPHQYKRHPIEKVLRDSIKFSKARKIIVALSGGADSVALLTALSALRRPDGNNLEIFAAHCNFHLRGDESMRDQRFVTLLCSHLNIPLIIQDFDVEAYRRRHPGTSVEMACRDLRYDWFRSLKAELKADRIATGHNADDNIETLFLNLLRGSGTTGLRGMLPDNGTNLRPLLSIHRSEIESYLSESCHSDSSVAADSPHSGRFIVDSTNLSSDYRRNFLRNEVLPMLRERWPGMNKSLDRSLRLLKAENDIIEKAVADALPENGQPLPAKAALAFPAPELLVRRFVLPLRPLTTTPEEIVGAMRANKPDIRRWRLPGGTALLRGGKLYLSFEPTSPENTSN